MKLLRFGDKHHEKPGLLDAQGHIRDLSGVIDDIAGDVLAPASLARLRDIPPSSLPLVEGTPRLGVRGPRRQVHLHRQLFRPRSRIGDGRAEGLVVFGKWTSAISGPNDDVEIPRGSENRLGSRAGVVIGWRPLHRGSRRAVARRRLLRRERRVGARIPARTRRHVGQGQGQRHVRADWPWLVTADEVPDPHALRLWLEVDGHRYQNGTTATMVFRVPHLISYLSRFMSLQPGDVISTGTPPGVGLGQKPPVYLRAGQVITLGIDGPASNASAPCRPDFL